MTGLADTAHGHPAVGIQNDVDRALEMLVKPGNQAADRSGLDLEHFARKIKRAGTGGRRGGSAGSCHNECSIASRSLRWCAEYAVTRLQFVSDRALFKATQ